MGTCTPSLSNCIVWGNSNANGQIRNSAATPTYNYCDIEGGVTGGTGNINTDPTFVSMPAHADAPTTAGDLHLYRNSPCIDSGSGNVAGTDLDGEARTQNGTVDMGAYEGGTPKTIYVNASAAGANDGTSWTNAYTELNTALGAANTGDEVWVVAGTYKPTTGADRTISFAIPSGVKVYGGFTGTESLLNQRDWKNNVCTLSGDIGTGGDNSDNSYHVVTFTNAANTTILDGFSITEGNADGGSPFDSGAGIYNDGNGAGNSSSPQITNCIINENNAGNNGGGLYNYGEQGTASPKLTNCTISENSAGNIGGGIVNDGKDGTSSPDLINCIISGNSALHGGGLMNNGDSGVSNPKLTNCIIGGNSATNYGGGIFNYSCNVGATCNPSLTNCTINGNNAGIYGGAIFNQTSSSTCIPDLTSCIVWGNSTTGKQIYNLNAAPTYSFCNMEGSGGSAAWNATFGTDAGNNIDANPTFVDMPNYAVAPTTAGDLHLYEGSPCIDSGNGNVAGTDLDGETRTQNGTVDMGVYEGGETDDPIAVCRDISIWLDASGNATITASSIDNGSTSRNNKTISSLVASQTAFSCSHVGTPLVVTLTVTDSGGDTASCTSTVTVADNEPPTASCQSAVVQLDTAGNGTLALSAIDAGSADACGTVALVASQTAFTCSDVGANTVVLTLKFRTP